MRWLIALSLCWASLAGGVHAEDVRTERRLLAQLGKAPANPSLLLQYAELAVPCDGPTSKAKAAELLRRMTKANIDWERRIVLHAALAHAIVGQHEEALAKLGVAIQRQDVASAACARQIAAWAIRADQLGYATDALALAYEALPQDAAIPGELAKLWLARGRVDRALPLFAERFALATGDLTARRDLAYALAADGRADEALSLLAPAHEACQQDGPCALSAARIALEADHLEQAHDYLRARLQTEPQDLDALFLLGDVYTRAQQLDQARATYTQILKLRPESVRAAQALQAL